jgi:AcrR family transcriptional regulator
MVRAAAQLIRRQGVAGTGLREVVTEADAPRGSLQHYFPGGKDDLVEEALGWMTTVAVRRVDREMERMDAGSPSQLLHALVGYWRRDLEAEGYVGGCPLVAAAADVVAGNDRIRQVLQGSFETWQSQIASALRSFGIPGDRAAALASLVISSLEGAIVLCRVQRDLNPLDVLVAELGPVLDSAASASA